MLRVLFLALMVLGAGGCRGSGAPSAVDVPMPVSRLDQAPPGAAPGSCWGKSVRPARFETVTSQVRVRPRQQAADGSVQTPATYRTETHQRIVRQRQERWFQAVCAADLTPDFVASVQRALVVRKLHPGPVTGRYDRRTRAAVQKYQDERGLRSGVLSIRAARALGLVSVPRKGQD